MGSSLSERTGKCGMNHVQSESLPLSLRAVELELTRSTGFKLKLERHGSIVQRHSLLLPHAVQGCNGLACVFPRTSEPWKPHAACLSGMGR